MKSCTAANTYKQSRGRYGGMGRGPELASWAPRFLCNGPWGLRACFEIQSETPLISPLDETGPQQKSGQAEPEQAPQCPGPQAVMYVLHDVTMQGAQERGVNGVVGGRGRRREGCADSRAGERGRAS